MTIQLEAELDIGKLQQQLQRLNFDKLNQNLNRAEMATGRLNRTATSVGSVFRGLGPALAGAGLLSGLTSVVNATVNFDTAMRGVAAVTGATGTEFEQLTSLAKELGATTQFSASQVADAQRFLGQAGFDTNQILEATPGLLSLAAAGQLDLAKAADIASNVLSGFNLDAEETGRVSDVLAAAAASSNTNVQQLGDAFKFVAPTANALGVSVEEAAAAIGVLSDAGIQGGMAGTNLRAIMLRLVKPTEDAATAMANAGINALDANGDFVGLETVIGQVSAAMESGAVTTSELAGIFGTEAVSGILALVNAGGRVSELTDNLEMADGAAQAMADTINSGPQGAINGFRSSIEGLQIAIGDAGLIDAFESIVRGLTSLVRGITSFAESYPTLTTGITLFGSAAAAFGVASAAISVISPLLAPFAAGVRLAGAAARVLSLALVANPIGLIITGIAAAITAAVVVWKNWDSIIEVVIDTWNRFKQALTGNEFLGSIADGFNALLNGFNDGLSNIFGGLGGLIRAPINSLIEAVEDGINSILENIPSALLPRSLSRGIRIPRLQSGGLVSGPGSGTSDSILAFLSNGEFVVNAQATRDNEELLRSINSGRTPSARAAPINPGGNRVVSSSQGRNQDNPLQPPAIINISGNVDDRAIQQMQQVIKGSPRAVGAAGNIYRKNVRGLNRRFR